MAKLTLTDPASAQASQILSNLAANNALVESAIENTLSRDGSSPNTMEANLDMNSNRVMNLPVPVNDAEPVRKAEFDDLETELTDAVADMTTQVAAAAASAAAALVSETNAAASEAALDTAVTAAQAAQTAAEAAQAAAELAETNAETAETAAELAETNAETAETNAETAQAAAEAAQTAAELAETNAETAQAAAELAETNAETAETNAELAETNAELAETNAETAEVAAETAQAAAETAQAAAEAAQAAAEAAAATAIQGANSPAAGEFAKFTDASHIEGRTVAETKSDLSLNNVDNTSDADKPVSTATQTALDLKAPLANPTFTGSFTSPGIDDNATGERLQIADTVLNVGSSTSASEYWVIRPIADGLLGLGGDDAADQGANIRLYGAGHATKANDFDLRQGTSVIAQWDSSAAFWTFTNDVEFNAGVYIEEMAAARTDFAGYGQFWVETATPNIPKFTDDAGSDFTFGLLQKAQTWTAIQTLTDPAIIGTILEDVFTITDGAGFEIDPGNGSIQLITLGASRTPAATNFANGESVTMMIADGSAFTITWTTVAVTWVGGSAPTLATSGYTVVELWKVGGTIYGLHSGDVA